MVELLVVIAIIALLAALLLPALKSAREKARRVVCLSNQRQMGIATISYCGDFNFFFPHRIKGYNTGNRVANLTYQTWGRFSSYDIFKLGSTGPLGTLLATGYLTTWNILFCPSLQVNMQSEYGGTGWYESYPGWWYKGTTIKTNLMAKFKAGTLGTYETLSAGMVNYFYIRNMTNPDPNPDGSIDPIYTSLHQSRLTTFADYWDRRPPWIPSSAPERGYISPALFSCLNVSYAHVPFPAESHRSEGVNCFMVDGSARWVAASEVYGFGPDFGSYMANYYPLYCPFTQYAYTYLTISR